MRALYKSALAYKITKATFFTHAKGARRIKGNTGGWMPALSYDVEERISNCTKILEEWSAVLSKKETGRYT